MNGAIIAAAIAFITQASAQIAPMDCQGPQLEPLGAVRVTEYCPACNEPHGYSSASGKTLEEGDAACSWLPMGSTVWINGEPHRVVDTCGTEAIDIFVDASECQCSRNEYLDAYLETK